MIPPAPDHASAVASSNHSADWVSNTSWEVEAGCQAQLLPVPPTVDGVTPPLIDAPMRAWTSLAKSWPVAVPVTSRAVRYGAIAWSRVPVSAVGNVQLGLTVGANDHGIRRVAAVGVSGVPSR